MKNPFATTFAKRSEIQACLSNWKMLASKICKERLHRSLFDSCAGLGSAEVSTERWTSVKFWAGELQVQQEGDVEQ